LRCGLSRRLPAAYPHCRNPPSRSDDGEFHKPTGRPFETERRGVMPACNAGRTPGMTHEEHPKVSAGNQTNTAVRVPWAAIESIGGRRALTAAGPLITNSATTAVGCYTTLTATMVMSSPATPCDQSLTSWLIEAQSSSAVSGWARMFFTLASPNSSPRRAASSTPSV